LAEYLVKLSNADYLKPAAKLGRMKFYTITYLGKTYLEVYENLIKHIIKINRQADMTKTSFGNLLDEDRLKNIAYIINKNNTPASTEKIKK